MRRAKNWSFIVFGGGGDRKVLASLNISWGHFIWNFWAMCSCNLNGTQKAQTIARKVSYFITENLSEIGEMENGLSNYKYEIDFVLKGIRWQLFRITICHRILLQALKSIFWNNKTQRTVDIFRVTDLNFVGFEVLLFCLRNVVGHLLLFLYTKTRSNLDESKFNKFKLLLIEIYEKDTSKWSQRHCWSETHCKLSHYKDGMFEIEVPSTMVHS